MRKTDMMPLNADTRRLSGVLSFPHLAGLAVTGTENAARC